MFYNFYCVRRPLANDNERIGEYDHGYIAVRGWWENVSDILKFKFTDYFMLSAGPVDLACRPHVIHSLVGRSKTNGEYNCL